MAGKQESVEKLEDGLEHRDPATPEDVARFVEWYEDYAEAAQDSNDEADRDEKYVHHKQWTDEEKQLLEARRQPIVTYNRIAPKINFIRGWETRNRVDPSLKPRTPVHHDDCMAATDALRYAADVADFEGARSTLTEQLLVRGCGGVVVGVNDEGEVTLSPVRARRFFFDPYSVEPDFSDARYLGVVVWWDHDDAIADPHYGKRKDVLDEALAADKSMANADDPHEDKPSDWADNGRKRIRICEIYYQETDKKSGKREWHVCHFTKSGALIDPKLVNWRDEKGRTFCPLIATSALVDEENNRYGIVRGMISPQDEINKRRSRALWEATMRTFMYEEDAVEDPDEFSTEIAKADGKARVRPGTLSENKIQLMDPPESSQSQMALYQDAKMEIDATGPSMPVIAGDDSVLSGRAIMAKQSIGSMELETIFDHIRRWQKSVFKAMWRIIRVVWHEEKWLRVTDSARKEGYRFVAVNRQMTRGERILELVREKQVPIDSAVYQVGLPPPVAQRLFAEAQQAARGQIEPMMAQAQQAGQQMPPDFAQQQMEQLVLAMMLEAPVLAEPMRMNDIAQLDVDIIVDVSPDTSIIAQEQYQELLQVAGSIMQIPNPAFQKELIAASNLRNKEALMAALDQNQDPAAAQMQQQQMQMQMQTMAMQLQQMQANVQRLQAAAAYDMARAQMLPQTTQAGLQREAMQTQAEMQKTQIEAQTAQQKAQIEAQKAQAQSMRDLAQAQIGIPAQAERDRAAAMSYAVKSSQPQVFPTPGVPR